MDHARRRRELSIKEALHIQLTLEQQHFNRDVSLELLDVNVFYEWPYCECADWH